ncbi:protein suppressor 2 of zeste [Eurosta solidaginis]|uniref:protein suppressor 2 of zeste n=1 Tax=Eurosta solidaginis TaxID=178769 RepID=UPI003530C567
MKLQTPKKALKVRDFNELLSCQLCGGYLINPTTVDNCLHTYCRSCIVQHLQRETFCPQCTNAGGSKQINLTNLKSDDALRALIFKLIPGLYQKERDRILQFKSSLRNGQKRREDDNEEMCGEQDIIEENFFAPTEPISLSLEYHPALLKGCSTSQIPPVRYLQCPAGLKIRHLKRLLCSKFDIDPESKRIEVEVIYEDEVLPNDFTLMDVGYCYNWKRHAPMKFTYRILFYDDETQKQDKDCKKSDNTVKQSTATDAVKAIGIEQNTEITLCDETNITTLTPTVAFPTNLNTGTTQSTLQNTDKSKIKISKHKKEIYNKMQSNLMTEEINAPVKMIIARKTSADSGKKPSPKHSSSEEVTYTVTNDFKSLRSNDMRYSDYAVSSTTSNSNSPKSSPKSAQRSPKSGDAALTVDSPISPVVVSKCDIVVSIPQSQMPKSPYAVDDEFENISLAQLKTASKKSPSSAATTTTMPETPKSGATRNVPKLKIELNSLKTRLSISKPKSAGVETCEKRERIKQRKHSLDEVAAPLTDHLDLETYAKNIGLLPIEVLTPPESADTGEKLKYSPNASPLSSASSTTSSSNNAFPLGGAAPMELTATSSFHKKRKKKHSRDSKDGKEGKRRRMHAEISSKPEEESLKMKVKLTPSHTHKSHKSESSSSRKNSDEGGRKSQTEAKHADVVGDGKTLSQSQTEIDNILALNKTLGEESRSINHLMRDNEKSKDSVTVVKADETLLALPHAQLLPKPLNNIKETKLPASPPLPPSLFKTTPLSFNALTVTSTSANPTKHTTNPSKQIELTKTKQLLPATLKPTSNAQYNRQSSLNATATKSHPNFIVPSLPRRPSPGTSSSYTPSSIASSSNKQLGLHLKRSASLDESYAHVGRAKQPKLDAAQRKTLYNSYANKHFTPNSTNVVASKIITTNAHSAESSTNSAITITARSTGDAALAQSQWKLPPYTPLHLPLSKPAVEIVRINSNQTAVDIQLHPAANSATKGGSMMAPPLPTIKSKKAIKQTPPGALPSTGAAVKMPPIAMSTTLAGQSKNNTYRLTPPALVNLPGSTISSVAKKVSADIATTKTDIFDKPSANNVTGRQIQQRRNSLRDFRLIRDHSMEIVDITGSSSSNDEIRPVDTTTSAAAVTTASTARESLEAALNKIKQNITSTTAAQDHVAGSAAKQQLQAASKEMGSDDLQNLHLLSDSATSREKIAIRASQAYEKPKIQQSTLVRQQNASVRNIPNPSALAFRNMSTLTTVGGSTTVTTTHPNGSTASKTARTPSNAISTLTQQKTALTDLTTGAVSINAGNMLHSTTNPTINTTSGSNIATSTTTTAPRTVKKPTTIDQVAANLNMRASAAAAEAHAAKVSASEDFTQISSSTNISTTDQSKVNELTKPKPKTTSASQSVASSITTTNVPSVTAAEKIERAREQQAKKSLKTNNGDEELKAKVLPKSIGDSAGVTTTIATDVASIKNSTNNNYNNNNNNNNSNNNNNNNNSKNNNSSSNNNSKLGETAASVTSD